MSEFSVKERGVEIGRMRITSTSFVVLRGPKLIEVFGNLEGIMGQRMKAQEAGERLQAELSERPVDLAQMVALVQRKLEGFGYTLAQNT